MGLSLVVGIVILVLVVAIKVTLFKNGIGNIQPITEVRAVDIDNDGNADSSLTDKCYGDEDPDFCTPWNDQRDGPSLD